MKQEVIIKGILVALVVIAVLLIFKEPIESGISNFFSSMVEDSMESFMDFSAINRP